MRDVRGQVDGGFAGVEIDGAEQLLEIPVGGAVHGAGHAVGDQALLFYTVG